jgi:TPR repeat protein
MKALRLIRPLANDGEAAAQYNLGLIYVAGRGAQQDYVAAAEWFRKAATLGSGPSTIPKAATTVNSATCQS